MEDLKKNRLRLTKKSSDLFMNFKFEKLKNYKIQLCESWFPQIIHIRFIWKHIHTFEIMSTHCRSLAQIQKIKNFEKKSG